MHQHLTPSFLSRLYPRRFLDPMQVSTLAVLAFAASCSGATPLPLPLPTPAQLAYQRAELVATVGFQMDTYAYDDGDPGCNPTNWNHGVTTSSPAALAPTHLNTTQWAAVLSSFGAKYAWMDAKHGCGFLLWPTKTTLPDGSPYGYDVGAEGSRLKGRDVVKEFRDSMRGVGIGPGYCKVAAPSTHPDPRDHSRVPTPACPSSVAQCFVPHTPEVIGPRVASQSCLSRAWSQGRLLCLVPELLPMLGPRSLPVLGPKRVHSLAPTLSLIPPLFFLTRPSAPLPPLHSFVGLRPPPHVARRLLPEGQLLPERARCRARWGQHNATPGHGGLQPE